MNSKMPVFHWLSVCLFAIHALRTKLNVIWLLAIAAALGALLHLL